MPKMVPSERYRKTEVVQHYHDVCWQNQRQLAGACVPLFYLHCSAGRLTRPTALSDITGWPGCETRVRSQVVSRVWPASSRYRRRTAGRMERAALKVSTINSESCLLSTYCRTRFDSGRLTLAETVETISSPSLDCAIEISPITTYIGIIFSFMGSL